MSVTSTRAHFRTKYYSLNCFPLLLMFTRDEKSLLKPIQWLFCHKKGNLCLPISVQKVKDNLTSFEVKRNTFRAAKLRDRFLKEMQGRFASVLVSWQCHEILRKHKKISLIVKINIILPYCLVLSFLF